MKIHSFWRLTSLIVLLAMIISPTGLTTAAYNNSQPAAPQKGMRVVEPSYVGVSQPLHSLAPIKTDQKTPSVLRNMQDRLVLPKTRNATPTNTRDSSIVQNRQIGPMMPAPEANFEGVNNINGVLPPDTQGDVGNDPATGKKYYIQWVNLSFEIWDVSTPATPVSVYGPAAGNTLWAGTGTLCASYNDGDPITQFDHLANRWMMSQFALQFPDNFHQCIAVSASADPLGAWYLYDYQMSTVSFNDYPHFGVWSDGYYMSINQFDGVTYNWAGAGAAVFERSAMLSGLPARMIFFDIGATTLDYGGMLPSDLDGPGPVAGTPNYFAEWDDSTWLGDAADTLRIWEFKTDWATPANSSFGTNASYDANLTLTTADLDPDMCNSSSNCIPQPGTAQGLDAISDRLMYRLQYRNFGAYQTLVGNRTVDATGTDQAGVYWFELRDTGSGFAINQQGVYAPDSENRWMASAAMDVSGDIAVGYSVSSSTTYPSIRYAGRLAADAANTLPQAEASLIAGNGYQSHSASRWGDYSMLALDSTDDCTFWYTQEYIQTSGNAPWQTRVGSFKFPSCTPEPTGVLTGTVTDNALAPLAGATVEVSGGYSTLTNSAGHYAFDLVAGTYDVTASKYGYAPSTVTGVVVVPPATTTQDFALTAVLESTISGVVRDATTGWPLYARLDIYGYPDSPVFTDPVTGAYSVGLVIGDYTFTINAMSGGYTPSVLPLTVSADATQDFALAVDQIACTAPGYESTPAAFSEDFETWPPSGWTIVDNIASGGLTWDTNTTYGDQNYTGGAGTAATVDSDANQFVDYDTELQTPVIDPNTLATNLLVYKANYLPYNLDSLDLDIMNVGDMGWTNISHWTTQHGAASGLPGEIVAVDLSSYITANFQLRWHYYTPESSPWDYYAQVDEVGLGVDCQPVPSTGLVTGAVYDMNTSLGIPDATVMDAAQNPALMIDASADPATPDQVYVIGEPAGAQDLTASTLKYTPSTESPVVVAGGTVGQDFHLAAGQLSANPSGLSFEVSAAAPTDSQTLSLANTGSAPASYEVFAVQGVFNGYAPTGPFADHTRHFGPPHLSDPDASSIRADLVPQNIPEITGGAISASWPTGLPIAWGIGFNTDANDLWLSNPAALGGDDLDHRFTTAGVVTTDTIDTAPWVGVFGADMTYNPFTNMLWQVNVGGDNCIYELDPASMAATGVKICPAFGTSERGLTFDPLTNTYYAGSWNDGIVNHFAPDGTLLDSANVNLPISGLAYNPSTGHLFVMNNNDGLLGAFDVYVLDTNDAYNIIGGFNLKDGGVNAFGAYDQAGLELDCAGNLWAVDQGAQMVYVADSGESGVCDWQAPWLSASPTSGSLANPASAVITTTVDATGMPVGVYPAYLRVSGDTPYTDTIVQITMTVTDTAPTITSDGGGATASRSVAENTTYVTTVTATDLESDPLTYSISGGADAAFFSLTGTPGVLAFIAPPDFEKPKDSGADNIYEVIVEVSDGTLSTTQTINVTVLDMVESYSLFLPVINH